MARPIATVRECPVQERDFPCMEIENWKAQYGLVAGVTLRARDTDLGLWGPGRADSVLDRWVRFQAAFGQAFDGVLVGRQVHGREIGVQDSAVKGILLRTGLDGHVTRQPGVLLAVTVADCVPVYLAHPDSKVVAILHAGWRGVAAGIVEAGIDLLQEVTASGPGSFVMHCGVSICGKCYEVGPPVVEAVTGAVVSAPALLDLRSNLAERAASRGVVDISVSGFCSAHDSEFFYSHRASGGKPGRMVAYIGYPNT